MGKRGKEERLYRIGEAAAALDLKTCVLRFWESEFPQLEPVRTPKGQRLYSEENMALLRRIQSLLHEQGMTIEGAKRVLAGGVVTATAAKICPEISASPSAKKSEEAAGGVLEPAEVLVASENGVFLRGTLGDALAELQSLRQLLDSAEPGTPCADGTSVLSKGS